MKTELRVRVELMLAFRVVGLRFAILDNSAQHGLLDNLSIPALILVFAYVFKIGETLSKMLLF